MENCRAAVCPLGCKNRIVLVGQGHFTGNHAVNAILRAGGVIRGMLLSVAQEVHKQRARRTRTDPTKSDGKAPCSRLRRVRHITSGDDGTT